jgi:hypothetical protein
LKFVRLKLLTLPVKSVRSRQSPSPGKKESKKLSNEGVRLKSQICKSKCATTTAATAALRLLLCKLKIKKKSKKNFFLGDVHKFENYLTSWDSFRHNCFKLMYLLILIKHCQPLNFFTV